MLVVLVYYLSEVFGLLTLNWLLANFLGSIFLVVIILFQSDIRNALSQVGAGRLWRKRPSVEDETFEQLVTAMLDMAKRHIGALVVIEKNVPLGDLTERGVTLDARLSRDLLLTIFHIDTPLHDGAVLLRAGRVLAAGCILPLASGVRQKSSFGTRHRAAIGVTEKRTPWPWWPPRSAARCPSPSADGSPPPWTRCACAASSNGPGRSRPCCATGNTGSWPWPWPWPAGTSSPAAKRSRPWWRCPWKSWAHGRTCSCSTGWPTRSPCACAGPGPWCGAWRNGARPTPWTFRTWNPARPRSPSRPNTSPCPWPWRWWTSPRPG